MSDDAEGCVAVLPPGDSRRPFWVELFGGCAVPVATDTPQFTILPDESKRFCYFVDFTSCDWLMPRIRAAMGRRPQGTHSADIDGMLKQGIYPIIADNVTVIRASRKLFRVSPQDEENGLGVNGT